MNRFRALLLLVVSWLGQAAARPDLVIFLTDDHGQLDSTPYGGYGIRTPHIQRLADAGLTFTRAYVASPSCAPSRAASRRKVAQRARGHQLRHKHHLLRLLVHPAAVVGEQVGLEHLRCREDVLRDGGVERHPVVLVANLEASDFDDVRERLRHVGVRTAAHDDFDLVAAAHQVFANDLASRRVAHALANDAVQNFHETSSA